jgi:uncharacterized protein (TIGR03435 family)
MRVPALIASALLVSAPIFAQQRDDSNQSVRFEVTSVKQATVPDTLLDRMRSLGGSCGLPALERSGARVAINASSVCGLVRVAYNVADYQVVNIPVAFATIDVSNVFDIDARVEGGTPPTVDAARLALQALLAERFQLRVHRDVRDMPIYALVPARGGPTWPACTNPNAPSSYVPGRIISCTPPLPMTRFAQFLTRETGRAVVDKTGLDAHTFELHWLPESAQAQPDSPPTLFTAIQEQLGLKLESSRASRDVLVIDRLERPTAN